MARMRASAISQYFLLISIPIKFLPNLFAATAIVPLPKNGSTIKSPLFVVDKIIFSAISSGIGQLCLLFFLLTFLTWFICHQSYPLALFPSAILFIILLSFGFL